FTDPDRIQSVRTWAPNELLRDPKASTRVQHQILDAIAALPGVQSAAFTSALPMEGPPFTTNLPLWVEGRPVAAGSTPPPRSVKLVSPGYFKAMDSRII